MWEKELAVAGQAARAGGEILNRLVGNLSRILKKGEIDLVTDADLEAEQSIISILRRGFPKDAILSEEAGKYEQVSQRTWLIDPLDGTTNFAHGFPFFAVSIALQVEEELVLGMVYNPWMEECFEATKGRGAYLNKTPIRVSQVKTLADSLLATGFPYDIHQNSKGVLELFRRMLVNAQGVRRPGSAALDLCYVAAGRFDGFWEQDLQPWDTAAGAVIAKEAGALLTTFEGESYSPYLKTILAANPFIHEEMRRLLEP